LFAHKFKPKECVYLLVGHTRAFKDVKFNISSFFLKIEDAAVDYFEGVVRDDNIMINMDTPQRPEHLSDYVESWRRKIWEQGFMSHLKGANYFKKGDSFMQFEGSSHAVRRVLFRLVW
jgi:hypothetical protein